MNDLQTLFDRDPLTLTQTDIQEIIKAFRFARTQFNVKTPAAKKPTPAQIDLEDLL